MALPVPLNGKLSETGYYIIVFTTMIDGDFHE
jgi:hypothetical protein